MGMSKMPWKLKIKILTLNNCLSQSVSLGKGIPYGLPPFFVQAHPHAYV